MKLLHKVFLAVLFLGALASGVGARAAEQCDASKPKKTTYGTLTLQKCGGGKAHFDVIVDGEQVLTDGFLSREDFDKNKGIWIYSNGGSALYLVDLSKRPVVVLRFGVKMSTNEFEFASWGKDRVVVAIKSNTRFVYQNGQMKLPGRDWVVEHALVNAANMEFKSDGTVLKGVDDKNFIPFVEQVKASE